MDGWTIGADVAAMLTSLSVVTATATWVTGRWRGWQRERAATRLRNWHGYIPMGAIDTWYVRLLEKPDGPTGKVVLEVVDRDGTPEVNGGHSVRQRIAEDGMLSRAPTPEEHDFLKALHRERGYGKGFSVR